jgi:quinoprotein glucose dehydrogenase
MGYVGAQSTAVTAGKAGDAPQQQGGQPRYTGEGPARPNIGPRGLPLIKPPWGRITAINLNTGDHVWMIPNGAVPDAVRDNPALKGIELKDTGRPERSPLLVTKTLLFGSDGSGLFNAGPGGGGKFFRAIDKQTGAIIFEMELPASTTGVPMTYMVNDKQYIVVATGARGTPAELIALAVP